MDTLANTDTSGMMNMADRISYNISGSVTVVFPDVYPKGGNRNDGSPVLAVSEVKYGSGVPLDSNKYVINIASKTTDVFRLKEMNQKTFFIIPVTGTLRNSLNDSITTIAPSPKIMSPLLLSWKCSINFSDMSLTVSPLNRTPKIPFTCDITTIIEVAVVKPDVTGVEIKSTKNPSLNENEDILTINEKELQDTPSNASLTVDIYPFDYEPRQKLLIPQSLGCFNGGFANQNRCICPPGFKGNNCEYGCGSNRFGTDCTGMCSIHQTQCRQMIFCTKGFGCKCPAGYSGFNCTKECTSGTYGVDCEQQCPEGCRLKSCNVYTGVCNKGCTASYIAPDCKEKYPWLKSPPKLESSDYRSLKLKIDLNTDNIQGSNNIKSVYYQIIFKIVSNESEFQYLELKEIGDQKSIIEITDNLKPGISYTFGVILVSEDGNYNIEDIKIVNYSTRCLLPKSTNYNVNLMSGTDNINVTWNKLNDQNEEDCKIIEYLLKLMYYNTDLKQLNYSEEIKSNNNHGYIFENLLSGEKYAVQVTAITATGQAEPSMLSYIYTEPNGQIQIKNIKTKFNENSSLIITWDIDEKYASTSLVYEIKYKVNKHFSCSNKIITNNWTSLLVYNKTRQEISNLIPNTQYIIKIDPKIKGYTYDDYSNMIYVKTPISKPKLKPVINDENSSYITNQSAYFNWKMNMTECSKLNGFFRGYQIILKNIVNVLDNSPAMTCIIKPTRSLNISKNNCGSVLTNMAK